MAFRHHEIAVLIETRPKEARNRILEAFVKGNASKSAAALVLGCRRATLQAWIVKLKMESTLEEATKIAKRDGWHHAKRGGAGCHRNRRASETSDPF